MTSSAAPARGSSLQARLEGADAELRWTLGALLIGAACAATFLLKSRGLLGAAMPDDARQFLSWMGRFDDPSLLGGDLVADYWRSVTPWFHRLVFRLAWALGLEPVLVSGLLPALLLPLAALFAFRFERAIGIEPFLAFLAAAGFVVYVSHNGTITSATPRAFWPVLLPALLDGLARRAALRSALAQLCLAGCYPQLTLVTATLIGLTLLDPSRPWRLDLSRRRLALVGACAAATVAGLLPFVLATGAFAPVVGLDDARRIPVFGPTGRNRVFEADGSLDFLCGFRLGLFPKTCRGGLDPRFWLLALLAFLGPAMLLARASRGTRPPGSALPFLLLVASLAWFAIAAAVLFRLHLPSRYATPLVPLMILATLPVLLGWAAARRPTLRESNAAFVAGLALALAGAASVPAKLKVPEDAGLVAFLRALPKDARVAGFVEDLDYSPVLTGRSTLFNRELAIGYQLGYLRPILARMADLRDAVVTADPAVLAERLQRNRVDILLVDAQTLAEAKVPERFRSFFPADELVAAEAAARAEGPPALARLAPACLERRFGSVEALDADCLRREAGSLR